MSRRRRLPRVEKQETRQSDSDTSGVSFHPDSDDLESDGSSVSTDLTVPEPPHRPHCGRGRPPTFPQNPTLNPSSPDFLPDFSDDPNDDTDEDLAAVPLDYGRSEKTKRRGTRVEQRWHK
jgi:hypothetical protein